MSKKKHPLADVELWKGLITPYTQAGQWECDYDLRGVMRFLRDNEEERDLIKCDFDPDFQRGHVWTKDQQRAWLVHFLRGGRNGRRLFFNMPGWQGDYTGTLELIDGKQRVEAIRAFLNDEVPVWGHFYSEIVTESADRYLLSRNTIRINVNTLKTRREVLKWYLQMNDGGTPHTAEELHKVRELLDAEI